MGSEINVLIDDTTYSTVEEPTLNLYLKLIDV